MPPDTSDLDTDAKGQFVRNDETTVRLLQMLSTAGLHLCDGETEEARFLYRSVLDSAYKADQGTRKKGT